MFLWGAQRARDFFPYDKLRQPASDGLRSFGDKISYLLDDSIVNGLKLISFFFSSISSSSFVLNFFSSHMWQCLKAREKYWREKRNCLSLACWSINLIRSWCLSRTLNFVGCWTVKGVQICILPQIRSF